MYQSKIRSTWFRPAAERRAPLYTAGYKLERSGRDLLAGPDYPDDDRFPLAMAAGIADHVWSLEEIANLAPITTPKEREPYLKRKTAD